MDGACRLGLEECVGCQESKMRRVDISGEKMA